MNPGLPQGFVKFDSAACRILRAMHECGKMRQVDIMEETGLSQEVIATALLRLYEYKYIFRVDLARKYETGESTQWLYTLKYLRTGRRYFAATERERSARRRANKRLQVVSVFNFRGEISI